MARKNTKDINKTLADAEAKWDKALDDFVNSEPTNVKNRTKEVLVKIQKLNASEHFLSSDDIALLESAIDRLPSIDEYHITLRVHKNDLIHMKEHGETSAKKTLLLLLAGLSTMTGDTVD